MADAEITVRRDDEAGRYEIHVGDELAGFTEFQSDSRGRVAFPHTEVFPQFEGQGLASRLVRDALTDEASRGETVVPLCPYIRRWLDTHEVPGLNIEGWHPRSAERSA